MSEEIKEEVVEQDLQEAIEGEGSTETPEEEVPYVSPAEEQARENGWVPKEEWVAAGHDPDEWRSAREFNDRGELINSIKTLNRKVQQYDKALKAFAQHHTKVYDNAHQKALDDLKAHKKLAIREGEHELAEEIDEEIEREKQSYMQQRQALRVEARDTGAQQEAADWARRNSWYQSDEDMRDAANGFMVSFIQKNHRQGNMVTRQDALDHATRMVKKTFPDKFGKKRTEAPAATGVRGRPVRSTKQDNFQLTEEETQVMKTLVSTGEMTKEQYIKEIKGLRGAK